MRLILQRVTEAMVVVNDQQISKISKGLLILLGIGKEDNDEDVQWMTKKVAQMRIFSDHQQKMNLSCQDIQGEALVVSQFTLFASTKKGHRPSYIHAASPPMAEQLYGDFCHELEKHLGKNKVKTGKFAANMKVNLTNDGPVTIMLDSKNKE